MGQPVPCYFLKNFERCCEKYDDKKPFYEVISLFLYYFNMVFNVYQIQIILKKRLK